MTADNKVPGWVELVDAEESWVTQVYNRFNNKCGNCGSTERLSVRLIVPIEDGGQQVATNGVVLCRACDLAAGRKPKPGASSFSYPFNFYLSAELHAFLAEHPRVVSAGKASFLRDTIEVFLDEPERFRDILQYQDDKADCKVNFHLPSEQFEKFRLCTKQYGSNPTEMLRALLLYMRDHIGST